MSQKVNIALNRSQNSHIGVNRIFQVVECRCQGKTHTNREREGEREWLNFQKTWSSAAIVCVKHFIIRVKSVSTTCIHNILSSSIGDIATEKVLQFELGRRKKVNKTLNFFSTNTQTNNNPIFAHLNFTSGFLRVSRRLGLSIEVHTYFQWEKCERKWREGEIAGFCSVF